MTSGDSDWFLSNGPGRPIWEPVRYADFADERLEALRKLRRQVTAEHDRDEDLAMYAILELLFTQNVVTVSQARAKAIQLATQMLPDPGGKRRKRLSSGRRDDLILIVGGVWGVFTSYNFPLNQKPEA